MKGSNLLAFIGGAVVGAAVALLYAPRSGRETREQIRDFAVDETERAKDFINRNIKKAKEVVEREIEDVRDAVCEAPIGRKK